MYKCCSIFQPFYGGKKHRISAEVFSPGERKPFLTVDGEWNGVMMAKWKDGVSMGTGRSLRDGLRWKML